MAPVVKLSGLFSKGNKSTSIVSLLTCVKISVVPLVDPVIMSSPLRNIKLLSSSLWVNTEPFVKSAELPIYGLFTAVSYTHLRAHETDS